MRVILFVVGLKVLTAMAMKNTILWDITPCSPLKVNRCFGGTWPPSSRSNKTRYQRERIWQANGLHGVISQKIVVLMYFSFSSVFTYSSLSTAVFSLAVHALVPLTFFDAAE
jgi:hypothetical protein